MNEKIVNHKFKTPLDEVVQSKEVLEYFKAYVTKPFGFLFLTGNNGTGKTFAAKSILNMVKYPTQLDIVPEYQSPYKKMISQSELNLLWIKHQKESGDTLYLLNQMKYIKILILDDLGTRTPSEAFMDFLYALIDYRYEKKEDLGTIITTNLNIEQMGLQFGYAFVSRACSGKCFRLDGPDRRLPMEF